MLIDIHCHCNLYLAIDEIIKEAEIQGVKKIISVGMSAFGLERVLEIAKQYDQIYPALGIHPEEVRLNKHIENQLESIIEFIRNNPGVHALDNKIEEKDNLIKFIVENRCFLRGSTKHREKLKPGKAFCRINIRLQKNYKRVIFCSLVAVQ